MDYGTKLIAYWGFNGDGAIDMLYRLPAREEALALAEDARALERFERMLRLRPGWLARACWSADPEDRE